MGIDGGNPMLDRTIKYSATNPLLALLGAGALTIGALFTYQNLPIDAVPDITNVQVQVNTSVGALSPETVEATITYPIESAMGAIPNVEKIRSITRYGLSQVTIIFREGTDIYLARQLVSERLPGIELPDGIRPKLGPISTGLGEVYFYSLEAKKPEKDPAKRLEQLMKLRTLQEWVIKPRFLFTRGVADVNTIGGYPEQYYVQPNLKKMASFGVHLDELETALRENNRSAGGGYINQTAGRLIVRADGLLRTPKEIRNMPVKRLPDFTVVRVSDIARVLPDRELRTGAAVLNGKEVVLGTVLMLLGENSRTVAARVDAQAREIRKALPDWVRLRTVYDRSDLVNQTIRTVQKNLIFGALLVIVVLMLLTGNIRAALITALVIPLSLGATLIGMRFFNISANLMSLGALDFGVIIDGAVIVMDACVTGVSARANREGRKLTRSEVRAAVADASAKIRKAAGFGQLIILVVFLPVFALTGIEGKMFRPMAAAFSIALFAAFLLAFSLVPALAGSLLSGRPTPEENYLMRHIGRAYEYVIARIMRYGYAIISGALLLTAAAGVLFFRMGAEFIPQLFEGSMAVQFVRPVTVNLPAALELESRSQKLLLEFPEVSHVFSRMGTAEIATDPMGVNVADTYVILKPRDEWPPHDGRTRTPGELAEAMRRKLLNELAGQSVLLSQPIQLRFNELLEGTRADVSLKIYGEDLGKLESLAGRIAAIIRDVPGVGDVESEIRGRSPILSITPRDAVLRRLGVSRKELLDAVEIGVGGKQVGHLYRGLRRFPIIIRLSENDRRSLGQLRKLPVGIHENFTVPLARLARLDFKPAYLTIRREQAQRRVAVLVNPRGRDTESVVDEARRRVSRAVKVPAGMYLEWGGNFQNLQQARVRLGMIAPISLAVIFFMIFAAFRRWNQTLLIFLLVPWAMVGGVAALALRGMPFSISAGIGFIAVSGIAVLNGVVLIGFANQLRDSAMTGAKLTIMAARLRLRAIIMTATTDIVGFLPMMLATGMGAEVQRPLATVVIGGIITATIGTLIILPIVLPRFLDERDTRET